MIYLDHAACSQLAPEAIEALLAIANGQGAFGNNFWEAAEQICGNSRRSIAELIGAEDADTIAFVGSTSEGLSRVADALNIGPGDRIVCQRGDFPSNVLPWLAQERRGAEVRFLEPSPSGISVEAVKRELSSARVLALSSTHYVSGQHAPLAELGGLARQAGATFVVDGIQTVGARPVDVVRDKVDVLVSGSHKWLRGPEGVSFVYVTTSIGKTLDPGVVGWRSCRDWSNWDSPTIDLRPDARVLETGSLNYLGISALGACASRIAGDMCHRWEATRKKSRLLISGLDGLGYEFFNPEASNQCPYIVSFRGSSSSSEELRSRLLERGVVVSTRSGFVRASVHSDNTEDEIREFLRLLQEVQHSS